MLWEISVFPREGDGDRAGRSVAADAAVLGISDVRVTTAHGYLVQGNINENQIQLLAEQLFADSIAERFVVAKIGDAKLLTPPYLTPHPCLRAAKTRCDRYHGGECDQGDGRFWSSGGICPHVQKILV